MTPRPRSSRSARRRSWPRTKPLPLRRRDSPLTGERGYRSGVARVSHAGKAPAHDGPGPPLTTWAEGAGTVPQDVLNAQQLWENMRRVDDDPRPRVKSGYSQLDSMLHRGSFGPGTFVLLAGRM